MPLAPAGPWTCGTGSFPVSALVWPSHTCVVESLCSKGWMALGLMLEVFVTGPIAWTEA